MKLFEKNLIGGHEKFELKKRRNNFFLFIVNVKLQNQSVRKKHQFLIITVGVKLLIWYINFFSLRIRFLFDPSVNGYIK
jgi:hypothetical protein